MTYIGKLDDIFWKAHGLDNFFSDKMTFETIINAILDENQINSINRFKFFDLEVTFDGNLDCEFVDDGQMVQEIRRILYFSVYSRKLNNKIMRFTITYQENNGKCIRVMSQSMFPKSEESRKWKSAEDLFQKEVINYLIAQTKPMCMSMNYLCEN